MVDLNLHKLLEANEHISDHKPSQTPTGNEITCSPVRSCSDTVRQTCKQCNNSLEMQLIQLYPQTLSKTMGVLIFIQKERPGHPKQFNHPHETAGLFRFWTVGNEGALNEDTSY